MKLKWTLTFIIFGLFAFMIDAANADNFQKSDKSNLAQLLKQLDKNSLNNLAIENTIKHLVNLEFNLDLITANLKTEENLIRKWRLASHDNANLPFKIPPEIVESPLGEISKISRNFRKLYLFKDLALIPGDQVLVAAYYDSVYSDAVIKFWKYKTGQEIRTQYIAFDPNNKLLGTMRISSDASTIIWSGRDKNGNIVKVVIYQLKGGQFVLCSSGC